MSTVTGAWTQGKFCKLHSQQQGTKTIDRTNITPRKNGTEETVYVRN
jgi:hypothetical protein